MGTFAEESTAKTQEIMLTRYQDELADAKKKQADATAAVEALEGKIAGLGGKKAAPPTKPGGKH
jgi:hypothetical protein